MAYNPNVLRDVLRARSLTRGQLSRRLGLNVDDLERELRRDPEPKQGMLNDIARELALPPFVFFMREAPKLHDILPDFRSDAPAPTPKSRATLEAIQLAEGIQKSAAQLRAPKSASLPKFDESQSESVEAFALRARKFFDITVEEQVEAKDARAFYVLCRKKIEDKGVFVLHESFPEEDGSGFCLSHPTHPVIVVNTKKQTRGRRLFTLIHELAHVLLQKSGISDPFVSENSTERLCNRFAGAFLVPRPYANALLGNIALEKDPSLDDVRGVARRLKISQEAAVLRLERLGFFNSGSHERWKKAIHNVGNPDFVEKGGGAGGPPPQEKVKLAKYGFRFALAFEELLRDGRIDEINLYRVAGIKPKYQRAYFEYAQELATGDLKDWEIDDE